MQVERFPTQRVTTHNTKQEDITVARTYYFQVTNATAEIIGIVTARGTTEAREIALEQYNHDTVKRVTSAEASLILSGLRDKKLASKEAKANKEEVTTTEVDDSTAKSSEINASDEITEVRTGKKLKKNKVVTVDFTDVEEVPAKKKYTKTAKKDSKQTSTNPHGMSDKQFACYTSTMNEIEDIDTTSLGEVEFKIVSEAMDENGNFTVITKTTTVEGKRYRSIMFGKRGGCRAWGRRPKGREIKYFLEPTDAINHGWFTSKKEMLKYEHPVKATDWK